MRDKLSTTTVINAMTGVILASGTAASTNYSLAVDTLGFKELLAVINVGTAIGTLADAADFKVYVEEAKGIKDVGSSWSTVSNDTHLGSAAGTVIPVLGATLLAMPSAIGRKLYMRCNDGVRSRYVRFRAEAVGSGAEIQIPYSIGVVLSRAADTGLYVTSAQTYPTGHAEISQGYSVCLGTAVGE